MKEVNLIILHFSKLCLNPTDGLLVVLMQPGAKMSGRVLIIDCLRADHLSSYGYSRETISNIDEFARVEVL